MPSRDSTGRQLSGAAKRRRTLERKASNPAAPRPMADDSLRDLVAELVEAIGKRPLSPSRLRAMTERIIAEDARRPPPAPAPASRA